MLADPFGRAITYLRISLTDRCNMRCVYCMPATGVHWTPISDLLSDDKIVQIVEEAVYLGVRKVRLTGGEPRQHDLHKTTQAGSQRGMSQIGGRY